MRRVLALLLAVGASGCEGPPGPAGSILELPADDDTYVIQTETGATNPHFEETTLLVSSTPGSASEAFMKFELSGFSDLIAAHLRFDAKVAVTGSGPSLALAVHGADFDGWDGDTMSWTNGHPELLAKLGTFSVETSDESAFDLDVTSFLVEQLHKGPDDGETKTEVTFGYALIGTSGSAGVSSLEEPDHAPRLLVMPLE